MERGVDTGFPLPGKPMKAYHKLQIPNFKSQISILKSQTSNLKVQSSILKVQSLNLKSQTSNLKYNTYLCPVSLILRIFAVA